MKRVFDLHNNVALKFQEIQYKYIDGIDALLVRENLNATIGHGLKKLRKLKDYYEEQLIGAADTPEKVKDIEVCFRCFDKPEGECHDCD